MQLLARRYDTGQAVQLETAGQSIARIEPAAVEPDATKRLPWIAPGLFDIQVNGYGGQEFSSRSLTAEKAVEVSRKMLACGVTRYCPTVTTESFQVMRHAIAAIAAACEARPEVARQIAGIHVEGPYLSTEDGPRGAHPREHCRPPDWDEFQRFQEAAGGRIRLVTLAAELDGAVVFIQRAVDAGVVVAIGHTAAGSDDIRRAVDAGARLSTHLGNGAHPQIRRHPNYIWDQLAEDRLVASLIVDGHHLPPAVVKSFIRSKTPSRCILVSDVSGQGGQPPGVYRSDFCDVEILPDGKLVIAGQRELLAGASMPLGVGVANVIHFAGVDLATAVHMATDHPARLLGLDPGRLEPGAPADLVLFDLTPTSQEHAPPRLDVRTVLFGGEAVSVGEQVFRGEDRSLVRARSP